MKKTLAALAVFLASSLFQRSAVAETSDYGSFFLYSDLPNVLFLLGEIKSGDSFDLRRAMRDYEIGLVVTASPGGSVYEGLQLASILNDKSINTYVPEDASCHSSCANIFLGGRKRMVLGELGVHQFYSGADDARDAGRKDVTTAATQYTTSEIIGILNEFDTPPFVYEKMFGTNEMYFFRGIEKQKLSRGADDERFLDQMTAVDEFIISNPSALTHPAPERSQVAAATPKPTTPQPSSTTSSVSERLENTDFFGMDLSPQGIRDISLNGCENYCKNNLACAAYSYVIATRWCWPKSGVENLSMASGVTSAIINSERINPDIFDRPFIEATGLDIPGYDLYPKGLRNMSLDQCRHACQATTNCMGFSYVPKKSWCFPKYGVGEYRDQLGIISGVVNNE